MQRLIETTSMRVANVFGVVGNVIAFGLEHEDVKPLHGKTTRIISVIGKAANAVSIRAYAFADRAAQRRYRVRTASFA